MASTFVCEAGDEWKYTFSDYGTLTYEDDGDMQEGTCWIGDARSIHNYLESEFEETGGWFDIVYKKNSREIDYIEDMDIWYPEK